MATLMRLLGAVAPKTELGTIVGAATAAPAAATIVDLGPEGGAGGGRILVSGTPETVAATPESYTGQFLAPVLENGRRTASA